MNETISLGDLLTVRSDTGVLQSRPLEPRYPKSFCFLPSVVDGIDLRQGTFVTTGFNWLRHTALAELRAGIGGNELAKKYGLSRQDISRWKRLDDSSSEESRAIPKRGRKPSCAQKPSHAPSASHKATKMRRTQWSLQFFERTYSSRRDAMSQADSWTPWGPNEIKNSEKLKGFRLLDGLSYWLRRHVSTDHVTSLLDVVVFPSALGVAVVYWPNREAFNPKIRFESRLSVHKIVTSPESRWPQRLFWRYEVRIGESVQLITEHKIEGQMSRVHTQFVRRGRPIVKLMMFKPVSLPDFCLQKFNASELRNRKISVTYVERFFEGAIPVASSGT